MVQMAIGLMVPAAQDEKLWPRGRIGPKTAGYSGESALSVADLREEERTKAVVMAQPHRQGVSDRPSDTQS